VLETTSERLADAVASAEPDDVIVALDPQRGRRVATDAAVLAAVERLDGAIAADGGSLVGRADAVAAWLAAGGSPSRLPADPDGVVFHRLDGAAGATVVVHGRLLDAAAGTEPVVAVSDDPGALAALLAELDDGGGRDLARILRYDDAIKSGEWSVPAPELIAMAFWTPAFCATLVRAAEATGAFGADPDDPVPGHEVSLAAISPRLFAHVEDDLAVRVMPVLHRTWPAVDYAGLRDAFVIKFTATGQSDLPLHHDVAQVSGSVKLNEGYEGGALEFPRQAFSNVGVPVGGLLAWPSLVTHPHVSAPVRRGVKYSLTLWLEIPHQQ
jgi:hypothetical protein